MTSTNTCKAGEIKIVAIGDGAVGKTCLLICQTKGEFPEEYIPTVFDNYTADVPTSVGQFKLNLWDTAGQEDYDALRPLAFKEVDAFLICFSVMSSTSLSNVKAKWIQDVRDSESKFAHVVLCGTKTDMREDEDELAKLRRQGQELVTTEVGQAMADELGVSAYCECSALTMEGVNDVFKESIRLSTMVAKKTPGRARGAKKPCTIL